MIDLHTHLLPGLDDGAQSLDMAVEMARKAVEDGIEAVVTTPHSGPGDERIPTALILDKFAELQERLSAEGIPLQLYPGEEVSISDDLDDEVKNSRILPVADSKWVLVELPFHHMPMFAEKALFGLQMVGYRPLIAHPERNADIQNDWTIAARFADRGAALQLDTLSLLGSFGPVVRKTAMKLLRAGAIHAIGSDGHSVNSRPIMLSAARDLAAQIVGQENAMLLVNENPAAIVSGNPIKPIMPVEVVENKSFFSSLKRLFTGAG